MTNATWLFLAVFAGCLVPVQTALNASVGKNLGHPVLSTAVVFSASLAFLLLMALILRPSWPTREMWAAIPPAAWIGGPLGAIYILTLIWVTPRIGVGTATVLVVLGQVGL